MHARSLIRAALIAVAAAAIFVATVAPVALGDGDPASDVLLGQNVFYPYQPPVTASLQKTLDAETGAAQKAGFPIKVALIASPVDLGVIPDLFGQPQKYANFLDQEISFQTKQRLLVVMSTGYGVVGFPAASQNALGSVASPAGKRRSVHINEREGIFQRRKNRFISARIWTQWDNEGGPWYYIRTIPESGCKK